MPAICKGTELQKITPFLVAIAFIGGMARADTGPVQIRFHGLEDIRGLSEGTIRAIAEDSTGFLWVGTDDGLYRYDGYDVRVYRAGRGDSHGLREDDITDLMVDKAGQLWITSWSGGLTKFDESRETFESIVFSGDAESVPLPNTLRSLEQTPDGSILVGSWGQGLFEVNVDDRTVSKVLGRSSPVFDVTSLKIADLETDDSGHIWLAAWDQGLLRFDADNGSWQQWLADKNGNTAAKFGRISSLVRRGNTIWVGSDIGGIRCFDTRTLQQNCEIPLQPDYREQVRDLYIDKNANLWIASLGGGLIRIDTSNGKRRQYLHNVADPASISSNDIYTLFEDSDGVLWVGSLDSGLSYFEISGQGFKHVRSDPFAATTLQSDVIRAFTEDIENKVWVGTDGGGLHVYDPELDRVAPFEIVSSVYDDRIWALEATPDGDIWIGTWGGGAYLIDPATGILKERIRGREGMDDTVILSLLLDSRNRLWITTNAPGVSVYNAVDKHLTSFRHDPADTKSLSSDDAVVVHEDSHGAIWIATDQGGINRYQEDGSFERLFEQPVSEGGLGDAAIMAFADTGDGRLWLGTTAGAAYFDLSTRRLAWLRDIEHAPIGRIVEIQPSNDGDLWMATDEGLLRFAESSRKISRFNRRDGIQGARFNNGASMKAYDGTLYFGGNNGFNLFDPQQIQRNRNAPQVVITTIKLFNEPLKIGENESGPNLDAAPHLLNSLILDHDQNQLSFEFAALHFAAPEYNTYTYKLEGLDEVWTSADANSRVAYYRNIPPGNYALKVRGSNRDGVWANDQAELAISILPPWWQTQWAYLTYVLLGAMLLFGLIRSRTYFLQQHAIELREEVRAKTAKVREQNKLIDAQAQELRSALDAKNHLFAQISHEFRTPLTLILGPLRVLRNRIPDKKDQAKLDLVERNTNRVLRLVEQLLGLAKTDAIEHDPRIAVNASRIVAEIIENFRSITHDKELQINESIKYNVVVMVDPDGFEQVILNVVSNAIKYTMHGGSINVIVDIHDDSPRIVVEDTGVGIAESDLAGIFEPFHRSNDAARSSSVGTGLGLAVVRERVQADDGEIVIDSALGVGTRVTITYPPTDQNADSLSSRMTAAVQLEVDTLATANASELQDQRDNALDSAPRILLVDDNPDILSFLSQLLEADYRCLTASNGLEALEITTDQVPDLVISDVGMPDMNGFELTHALKSDVRTSHIPIVLLTARADVESRLHGFEERADIYITKPFDPVELPLRISNLFGLLATRRQGLSAQLLAEGPEQLRAASEELPARDQQFLQKLYSVLAARYREPGLSPTEIANAVAMSNRQLQRKVRSLLNHSPGELLRMYRLHKARQELASGKRPAEVYFAVGFSSQAHFGACFKARYGQTPGQFSESGKM